MAKKLESIIQLAAEKAHEISANSGNYMAFLTTAAHNFKYSFRDQLLIYAQKPDATACAEIEFWNKYGRWVNRGTTGIALLVDTDQGYKLRHVFDMSDTNSREGRTIPIWQMKPQYEGPVAEALENSYGELPTSPTLPSACCRRRKSSWRTTLATTTPSFAVSKRAVCWKNWTTSTRSSGSRACWKTAWPISC